MFMSWATVLFYGMHFTSIATSLFIVQSAQCVARISQLLFVISLNTDTAGPLGLYDCCSLRRRRRSEDLL